MAPLPSSPLLLPFTLFLLSNSALSFVSYSPPLPQPLRSPQHCGPKLSIETPSCTVLQKRHGYELRMYPDGHMWAATLVSNATYKEAIRTGFHRCYDFISGKNSRQEKIEMTGPVLIKPVPAQNGYVISFFVPSRFNSVSEVPTPWDSSVIITVGKGGIYASYGPFGGFPNDVVYWGKWRELKKALEKDKMKFDQQTVTYAGYSSPFQYYNRKQEVLVEILPEFSS